MERDLRETLFEAVARGDQAQLEELCTTHREAIIATFETWQLVPQELRADPEALQRYATGLMAIARVFADRGDDQLLHHLSGDDDDDSPLAGWDAELQAAIAELEQHQHLAGGRRLTRLLEDTGTLQGSGRASTSSAAASLRGSGAPTKRGPRCRTG